MPAVPDSQQPLDDASEMIFSAIVKEAAQIAEMPVALDAELAVSALLGGVYAATDGDRVGAVERFSADFGRYLASHPNPETRAVRAAMSALLPEEVPSDPAAPTGGDALDPASRSTGNGAAPASGAVAGDADAATDQAPGEPAWAGVAGDVRCTGAWAVRDGYGDQTQYVATFAYSDAERGGPEHSVSYLLDHNLGTVKSISVGVPADHVVNAWRAEAVEDPDITVEEVAPGTLRAGVATHLPTTDSLDEPPREAYVEERAFAVSRLSRLPKETPEEAQRPGDAERDAIVADFLASPEAEDIGGSHGGPPTNVTAWCTRAAVDFAVDDNSGDPLRWSPTAVELMLLDWAPRQLSRTHEAGPWLPEVLDRFVAYAGRIRGQNDERVTATRDAVTGAAVRYTDLMTGDTLGEPVSDVLARMVADGVDPLDENEVLEWVLADRARRDRG